jgi:hypothetical protein
MEVLVTNLLYIIATYPQPKLPPIHHPNPQQLNPYGSMLQAGRSRNAGGYRFGFNGKRQNL